MTITRICMLIRQHYSLQSGSFCVKSMLICDKCVVCFLKRYIWHWKPFYLGHRIPWRTHTITKGCSNLVFYSAFCCKPVQIYKKGVTSLCLGAAPCRQLDDDCFYISTVLHSQADSLRSHVVLHEWQAFYSTFLNNHWSGVLTVLAWLVPHETSAVLVQVLCTPYNHASCHFIQSHMYT